MICCFPCNLLNVQKQMDISQLEKSSSTADYLQNERFCEEFCRNISESVEKTGLNGTDNGALSEHLSSLDPGDDIEDILHEISEILAAQSGNDSACTVDSINDSRSVEDILKDAEEIVGELSEDGDNTSLRNDGRTDEAAGEATDTGRMASSAGGDGNYGRCGETCVPGPSPVIGSSIGQPGGRRKKRVVIQEGPRPEETPREPPLSKRPHQSISAPSLSTLYEDVLQSAVLSDRISPAPSSHHNSAHKVDQQVEQLKSRINELTEKIMVHEQTEQEGLTAAEKNRLALLAEEVRSQEELIATYQRENQRLSADLTSAKVSTGAVTSRNSG